MDTQTARLLAKYNGIADEKMNRLIGALSDAQWKAKHGGYFDSVASLCNHIYVCDVNWLKRFSRLRGFEFIAGTEIGKGIAFGAAAFEDVAGYLEKRASLDGKIGEFAAEMTQGDLDSTLEYEDSHGTVYHRSFGGLVLHMFNHQTHHRGMISIFLEEMGIPNDYNNIYDIL